MKKLMIVLFLLVTASCSSIYFIKKPPQFISLYKAELGSEPIIKTGGYYMSIENTIITEKTVYSIETTQTVDLLLLYESGLIMKSGCYPEEADCQKIVDKDLSKNIKHKHLKYQWGTYQILKDTIKAQFIEDYGPMASPNVIDTWFTIISDTVISKIYEKELTTGYIRTNSNNQKLFTFYSYANRIDSTSNPYLKKKWFWDKEAYKKRGNKKK